MADKKISELQNVSSIGNNDLFVVSQPDGNNDFASKNATATQLGNKLNNDLQYASDLQTTSKTIIGAINELNAGGGGSSTLAGLDDVTITSPVDGQVITYDSQTSKWINGAGAEVKLVDSVSGPIANFTTSLALPLVALKAYIQAQGGGGTPSAPVAIVGWDNVKIYQRGVNLWDEEWEVGTFDNSTGEKKSAPNYWRSKNRIKVLPNTLYYAFTSGDNVYRFYYDARGNYIGTESGVINSIFTTPNNAYYLNIVDVTRNAYDKSSKPVCINYPSTDTQYHAYNPNSTEYTINLGQTVYGGYIEQDKDGHRRLTIDYSEIVALNTLTWVKTEVSGNICFYADLPNGSQKPFPTMGGKCSTYAKTSGSIMNVDNTYRFYGSEQYDFSRVLIRDDSKSNLTAEDFKSAVTGNIIYELATPIQTDITIPDITALVGENNIFADSGDVELSYFNSVAGNVVDLIEVVSGHHTYSTDEQIVGTWIDGSTMYEKSISVTSLAMDVGWKVIGNIAGIKDFIDCKQCLKSSDNIYTYSNLTAYYNYNNGDIGLYNDLGGNMGNMTGYVTVRYTKTST